LLAIDPEKFTKKFNSPLEHTNKKWFLNLTNKMIPPEVTRLLQFGEKFCMPIYFNKKLAIHEFIKDVESNMSVRNSNKQTMIRSITIPHFYKFLKSSPTNNYIDLKLDRMHNATKEFCRNNPNVIFTRADKGNITVALDRGDYIKKIEDLLNDTNTYTITKKNPIKSIETNLNNLFKNWLHKSFISKQQFYKLRSSDSLLPKAYGLPKVHKINTPFRLIVSSIKHLQYSTLFISVHIYKT